MLTVYRKIISNHKKQFNYENMRKKTKQAGNDYRFSD